MIIASFLLTGCGSYSDYVTQTSNSNIQMLELWKTSEESRRQNQTTSMIAFSQAMNNAANTPDSGDDVAIAMAFSYNSQQKGIPLPKMSVVQRPNDFVDGIKAIVPLMSAIVPAIASAYTIGKVVDDGNSGSTTNYSVNGDSNNFDSGNAGSYNAVGTAGDGLSLTGSFDNSTETITTDTTDISGTSTIGEHTPDTTDTSSE